MPARVRFSGLRPACRSRRAPAAALLLTLAGLAACESVLEVDQAGIIDFGEIEAGGPAAVPTLVNGVVGTYQEAVDDIVRYAALITDEMIAAGTFETRQQVDRRRIQPDNSTLTSEMYTPLHLARMQADTVALLLGDRVGDPAFTDVEEDLREGVALAELYGGYSRLWLGELYCWSILTGMFPESAPLLPDERVQQALSFLERAESRAYALGLEDVRLAAIVGQARARLWLRDYATAALLAAQVPRDFVYWSEYSFNNPQQFNEMYMLTWGDIEAIRWTIGDGSSPTRGNERWEHLDAFVSLNLIDVEPEDFTAFSSSIPVLLQRLYARPDARVLVASGVEAQLIRAEAAVRSGSTPAAESLLNDLRADYSFRATVRWGVEPPEAADELQPVALTGDLTADLKAVADERARELWLTGDRLTTSRRLRLDPDVSLDLFPPVKNGIGGGDDIAFPIPRLELDTNPNLSADAACPAPQQIGGWR